MADHIQAQPSIETPPIEDIADFLADPVQAASFPDHILRWRNDRAAATIALHRLTDAQWLDHFGRFAALPDNLSQPLALRYHGHQFGTYNPQLGDGRGFLFAQCRAQDGRWLDLGTKGSGQTPHSRFGDGRLTLKGAVRELLATEMLDALGVATSRTLSIVETGEALFRGDEPSPARSAVMVRLNHGHIRIGSFQRLAALDDTGAMERLLRYVLVTLLGVSPDSAATMAVADAAAMLVRHTVHRCAHTAASYMVAGFVHGVLNTDNINVTGESFDYGPWRFTPLWEPMFTAAYFDHQSLYAFGRQPQVTHWNVGQLAIALRLIAPAEPMIAALEAFAGAYESAIARQFCWRLAVAQSDPERDRALVIAAETYMRGGQCPIDQFFIDWSGGNARADHPPDDKAAPLVAALAGRAAIRGRWFDDTAPQSLHIEEVEGIWAAIADRNDWAPLYAKVSAIRAMGAALGPAPLPAKSVTA